MNSTEPLAEYENSGWKFQGDWGRFLGTAIAKNLFITAAHVGGSPGDFFRYQGERYQSIAQFPHPTGDLQIVKVADELPNHARLYSGAAEVGATAVYFGRGARRGSPVINELDDQLRGWRWGDTQAWRRWGINIIEEALETTSARGPQRLLRAAFDLNGPQFECHLSDGDSGGGLFIESHGGWRLAGVNVSVSGPYKTIETADPFNAALFSEDGFWMPETTDAWVFNELSDTLLPGSLYSMRLSQYQDWIQELIDRHHQIHHRVALLTAARPEGSFVESASIATTEDSGALQISRPASQRFFILKSRRPTRFKRIDVTSETIRFDFEFLDSPE